MRIIVVLLVFSYSFNSFSSTIDSLTISYQQLIDNKQYIAAIETLSKIGDYYSDTEQLDSAIFYYDKALELSNKQKVIESSANLLKFMGVCYERKGNYDEAIKYLYKALQVAENQSDKHLLGSIFINIGIVYFDLRKADDAIDYYTKALNISKESNDTTLMIIAINNIGNANMTLKNNVEEAIKYFEQTVYLGQKSGYKAAVNVGLTNLAEIYLKTGNLTKALKINNKALKYNQGSAFLLKNLANIYIINNQIDSALFYFFEALKNTSSEVELKQELLKEISEAYYQKSDFKNSHKYLNSYYLLKDSIHNITTGRNVMEIKTKYETEKKESEIQQLKLVQSRNRFLIGFLIAAIALIVIVGIYIIMVIRNRKIIAEQAFEISKHKISELEKDRQIVATTSALRGEETERTRIAKDLHDGLGGLLSGLKLTLNNMKENVILVPEQQEMFEHALKLLDESVIELRQVAHNMMPEVLMKYGLAEALDSFAHNLSENKSCEISFHFFGTPKRLLPGFELALYRVAQELVNNSLKHSSTAEVVVQLFIEEKRLCITIQDNGKGFDTQLINTFSGKGLQNIQARVSSFGGRFDINSQPGQGTESVIEFDDISNYVKNS